MVVSPFPSAPPAPDWPYLTLRAALHARDGVRDRHSLTLADAQVWWGCSDRTAKRQLSRLHAAGRLTYTPGRGRGHTSRVAFTGALEEELAALTAHLAAAGAAAELARLSRLGFPRAWVLTDAVRGAFGLGVSPAGTDRLRTVVTRPLTSLDPLTVNSAAEAHLLTQVLDPLLLFDPQAGTLRPHLAHHWDTPDDGRTWVFHLRKGVSFHHGRTLDAQDVQFTLERVRRGAPWYLGGVTAVQAPTPFMAQVTLDQPDLFFPRRLAHEQALILPRDVPFDERRPVGTGAFRWHALEGGFRLEAFGAHFAGRPLIDEVEVFLVPELRGDAPPTLDVTGAAPTPITQGPITQRPIIQGPVESWVPENSVHFLIWNAHRPAARSAALRAAVVELHDIRTFWQEAGRAERLLPATSFLPRRSLGRPPRGHSLARAQALLQEAAYAGPPLRVWVLDLPGARQEAEWLAARAARLGLPVQVIPAPLDALPDAGDDVDLAFMGEIAGWDEHLSFWSALKQPELLFRRLLPPDVLRDVDALLDGYRTVPVGAAPEHAALEALMTRVEARLLGGHHLHLTHHRVKRRAVHPLIRDVHPDAYGRIDFKRLWLGDARA